MNTLATLANGNWVEVESSNLRRVRWGHHSSNPALVGDLVVEFHNNAQYIYYNVPLETAWALLASESAGKYFNREVKTFACDRIA
jgi:hypothetical protein